jgi:hypothetical protein
MQSEPKKERRRSASANVSFRIYADGEKWAVTQFTWSPSGEKLYTAQSARGKGLGSLRDYLNTLSLISCDIPEQPICFEQVFPPGKSPTLSE